MPAGVWSWPRCTSCRCPIWQQAAETWHHGCCLCRLCTLPPLEKAVGCEMLPAGWMQYGVSGVCTWIGACLAQAPAQTAARRTCEADRTLAKSDATAPQQIRLVPRK